MLENLLPSEKPGSGPSRMPLILTALVWPGLGQFLQKRWLAGTIYSLGFLATFGAFLVDAFRILAAYYGMATDINSFQEAHLPLKKMLITFLLAIVFYIAAVVDTGIAYLRQRSAQSRQRHEIPPIPGSGR